MPQRQVSDTSSIGDLIRERRKSLGLRQPELALAANVGIRFVVDIENGKESCQIGLVLRLLEVLGIRLEASSGPEPQQDDEHGQDLGVDYGGYKP